MNLYNFQVENKLLDPIIKLLLRSYAGSFDDFVKINETQLAKRAKVKKEIIAEFLEKLHKMKILTYLKQSKLPQLVYTAPRQDASGLVISKENYQNRKEISLKKINAMLNYVVSYNKCRSQLLLSYFGEGDSYRCGSCDVCLERNKLNLSQLEFDGVLDQIKPMLQENPIDLTSLVDSIKDSSEDKTLKVIQWLIENGKIINNEEEKLEWLS
jgi:ATP-dependent DNA helicase RecQ